MIKGTTRYSEEFKAEAVKSIMDYKGNISAAARKLGIPMQTPTNWKNKPIRASLVLLPCVGYWALYPQATTTRQNVT